MHSLSMHRPAGDDMAVDSWPTVVDSTGGGVRDQRVRNFAPWKGAPALTPIKNFCLGP